MSDSHTPAVSSTGFSELRPAIRDAIADSLAEIAGIQNDEGSLTAERFEQCERRIRKAAHGLRPLAVCTHTGPGHAGVCSRSAAPPPEVGGARRASPNYKGGPTPGRLH